MHGPLGTKPCADPESFVRANIECWLGSFVILRGSGSVLIRKVSKGAKIRNRYNQELHLAQENPIFCDFLGGSGPSAPHLVPRMITLKYLALAYNRCHDKED